MKTLSVLAPAKINLYLNVAGKRPDGYHDIESVMQTVSLYDRLHLFKRETNEKRSIALRVQLDRFDIPSGKENLIYRAAELFFEAVKIPFYEIEIEIEKIIPTEAGLGGGSADAAITLLALNQIYETALSKEELCKIGVKLGADVPFCILGGTMKAEGIGEELTAIAPMPPCYLIIAMPKGGKVSTGEAYRKIDAIGPEADIPFDDFLHAMKTGDIFEIAGKLYNKFELVTPEETGSCALVRTMRSLGAIGARMSGSGAAVFGIFTTEAEAKAAYEALPQDMVKFICTPTEISAI